MNFRSSLLALTLTLLLMLTPLIVSSGQPSRAAAPSPTLAASPAPIYAEAIDWLNVRYGPGVEFPRIGRISMGTRYAVLRRDPDSAWLEIDYPPFVGGRGWVFREGVTITGEVNILPIASGTDFGYPTLTPTPQMVVTSAPLWTVTPLALLHSNLDQISVEIYDYLLSQHFDPATEMLGSVFLMDLQTGERYSINPGIAYSGMSLIKVPIMVAVYRKIAAIPTIDQAQALALMIICSENLSANQLLSFLGDGDMLAGVAYVTETMQRLGLRDTFLSAPLAVAQESGESSSTAAGLNSLQTTADQITTAPDPFNRTTPADLGWLLAAIYQCALDGTGVLPSAFPNAINMQKCRAMLRILLANDVPALLWAGVPPEIEIARKHGWTAEVHGDAGIVFTPAGDYVLVVMLRNRTWLNFEDSFPVIAEISRTVYNSFNPADPLLETHSEPIPLCALGDIDPQLFSDLRSGSLPEIR